MTTVKTFTTEFRGWQTEFSITIDKGGEVAVWKGEVKINWGFHTVELAEAWFLNDYLNMENSGTELIFINDNYVGS